MSKIQRADTDNAAAAQAARRAAVDAARRAAEEARRIAAEAAKQRAAIERLGISHRQVDELSTGRGNALRVRAVQTTQATPTDTGAEPVAAAAAPAATTAAPGSEEAKYDAYQAIIEKNGKFNSAAGARNLLAFRTETNANSAAYDDTLVMLWKDAAGGKHVREYQLSTEPSFAGEASLDPGYVEYQVERTPERGHPWERCLRMQSTYATHRDADADGAADADAAETTTDMQIHMGKDGDPWSAGCQTLPPAEFERFWHDLGDGADGAESGTKIGYTLVDRDADTQPIAGATETQSTQSAATVSAAGVTAEQLQQIMPDLSAERAAECLPYLNQAMNEFGITTSDHAAEQTAAFLAQLAHESGQLQYFEELADGSDYEGREDLGNTQPGDGTRYKGRGPIQLTGRANYREYGEKLGLDLENHPELASGLDVGFRIAGQYWKDHGLNELAAQGPGTFTEITERINGGHQGLESRQQFYQRAMEVLAGGLSTVDVASTPVTGAASSSSSTNGSSSSSTTDDGGASEVSDFSSPSSSTSTDPGCSVARSPAALQREMQAMGYDLDAQITAAILQLLDDSYDALIGALSNDSDFQAFVRSQPGMKRWRKGQPVPQAMIAAFLAKKMKRAGVTADPQGVLHARDGRPLGGWPDVQRALGLSPAAAPAAAVAA